MKHTFLIIRIFLVNPTVLITCINNLLLLNLNILSKIFQIKMYFMLIYNIIFNIQKQNKDRCRILITNITKQRQRQQ